MEKINNDSWKKANEIKSITDILYDYLRHWKWFIISVVLCLIIGTIIVLSTQKQYKPSLSILLNESKGGGSGKSETGLDLESLGLLSTTNNIDNEIAILSSPDLMRSVVDSLNLHIEFYIKKGLRKTEIYESFPFRVDLVSPDKDRSIEFSISKESNEYIIEGVYNGNEINETAERLPIKVRLDEKIELIISQTEKVVDDEKYYVSIKDISSRVLSLCGDLSISSTSKASSVINISLLCHNTDKGKAILRELVKQYNEMDVNVKNEIAYNTAIFINDRLKEISAELSDAEENVVDFKQKNQITDLSTESQLYVQQTGLNEQKIMEIETQLNVINLIERFVNDPKNKYSVIPNIGISDIGLSQIISGYNEKLLNSEVQLKGMGEENPVRIRITEDLDNQRSSISGSLNNVKQTYNVSRQDLLRQSYSTKSRVLSVPQQERGLIEKVREQRIKENLFLFLMQKREETNLTIASTANKARIIVSPQTNISSIAPQAQIIILGAFVFGLLLPIAVIYTLNLFKTQIRSRNELTKLSDVSIIGQIAKNEVKDQIVIRPGYNTGIAEMFRSLRNNVRFIFKHHRNQLILVTSTTMGEGKTFISVNLSMSFALSGKKVLLIGGDIRNPKLKDYINLNNKRGLSDYLIGDDSWSNYIQESGLDNNLKVMYAGTIPPNPNELLMSPRLSALFSEAKKEYDYIVIDTAPVGLVSDTYLLNDYADITLYVVREGVTPKGAANFINMQKEEGKLVNMYLVLNDSVLDNNYKYGYGKAYGYESKSK
ncbi:polysaccharide biosynthesis tyrosine autokinase [Dysgonomonas sp. OttesenSCG-928-D17]|nr:polysaccharide biosynthesis tyrosine autokinase [Dysgonomonas sp. OttesenSCG-928-D17]